MTNRKTDQITVVSDFDDNDTQDGYSPPTNPRLDTRRTQEIPVVSMEEMVFGEERA